jgi:hypothetical protein
MPIDEVFNPDTEPDIWKMPQPQESMLITVLNVQKVFQLLDIGNSADI